MGERREQEVTSRGLSQEEGQVYEPGYLYRSFSLAPRSESGDDLTILKRALDRLADQVAVLDGSWNIIATNDLWHDFVVAIERGELVTGGNYMACAKQYAAEGSKIAQVMLDGLRSMERLGSPDFAMMHTMKTPFGRRDFKVIVSRIASGPTGVSIITRRDVTEVEELRRKCRQQGSRVLKAQEDERRRIGRELHDSTSQLLTAVHLDLARLKQAGPDVSGEQIIADIDRTLALIHEELRATSYLFHPPALAEASLVEALDKLLRGFGKRTGLRTWFGCEVSTGRSTSVRNATLYRVAQEALANIHRHAQASTVHMRLEVRSKHLHLAIIDDGVGIPDAVFSRALEGELGVGITGMHERGRDLNGRLTIRRLSRGTCVVMSLPVEDGDLSKSATEDGVPVDPRSVRRRPGKPWRRRSGDQPLVDAL